MVLRIIAIGLAIALLGYAVVAYKAQLTLGPTVGASVFGLLFLWYSIRGRRRE